MRTFRRFALALCACALFVSAGCDVVDNATGVNKAAATADPKGGTVGEILTAADSFVPAPFNLLTKVLLAGLALYQQIRIKSKDGIIAQSKVTAAATIDAVGNFVKSQPAAVGEALQDHIQAAHLDVAADPAHTVALMEAAAPAKV